MPKVKYIGEKRQHVSSFPPGVLVSVEPGRTYDLDGGFEHLRTNSQFQVLDPKPAPTDEELKAAAARKRADEEEAARIAKAAKDKK